MDLEIKKRRAPGRQSSNSALRLEKPALEKDMSRAVIGFLEPLRKLGLLTYFVNLEGAQRSPRQQVSLKQQGARKGRPDIEVFGPDIVVFIELKRKKGGRLSEHQKAEILALTDLGHECHVVKADSCEDVVKQVHEILQKTLMIHPSSNLLSNKPTKTKAT